MMNSISKFFNSSCCIKTFKISNFKESHRYVILNSILFWKFPFTNCNSWKNCKNFLYRLIVPRWTFCRCRLHLGFFGSMELSYLPTKIPNCPFVGSEYPGFPLKVHVTNKQHGTLAFNGFIVPTFWVMGKRWEKEGRWESTRKFP